MDHATAILEDAGKAIDKSAEQQDTASKPEAAPNVTDGDDDKREKSDNPRKRKGNYPDASIRHGGRGRGDGDDKRHKKGDMGRGEYLYVLPAP